MTLHVKNVLIVDDDDSLRESMADYLRSEGHYVSALRSAEEAFEWLDRGNRPDLLISDYDLGGSLTGVDVIKRLRTRAPFAKYLCVTGHPDDARNKLKRWLYCDLLPKPFSGQELERAITRVYSRT